MARTAFAFTAVCKLLVWAMMLVGVYVAVRAFIDGRVLLGIVILIIVIPIVAWGAGLILALVQLVILWPLSIITRQQREYAEFANFEIEVAQKLQTHRFNLRQGWRLLRMFEELPPPLPGEPERSGHELLWLYEAIHADDVDE